MNKFENLKESVLLLRGFLSENCKRKRNSLIQCEFDVLVKRFGDEFKKAMDESKRSTSEMNELLKSFGPFIESEEAQHFYDELKSNCSFNGKKFDSQLSLN